LGLGISWIGIIPADLPLTAGAATRWQQVTWRMGDVHRRYPVGAETQLDGSTHFRVWAPEPRQIVLCIEGKEASPRDIALDTEEDGYHSVLVRGVAAGTRYWYVLDGDRLPDPASRYQPEGPFGPSEVVDPTRFRWEQQSPRSVGMAGHVIYEIHLGTFTPGGTWRSAIEKLPLLVECGISIVEVMPVADFPGRFGWGYDGVFPYAPAHQYGTPDDFRAFVDNAHAVGLGVILDVVYNHLGPDGCVFGRYAKAYYSKTYSNEWGDALNFDGPDAQPVRDYFASNAAYLIDEFRLDGLRLDATQTINDRSARHIIAEIGCRARSAARGRSIILVAESETQIARLVEPIEKGGCDLDAVWNDDFHHSAIVTMTGKREAYYSDHHGTPQELISAAKRGYLFQGQRSAWQRKPRGTRTDGIPAAAFVTFIENHDQIANSGDGSRVRFQTSPGRYRAMTALVLLMPATPMLFQGQEFGASAPFLYFADHRPELAKAVHEGRAEFVKQFPSLASPAAQTRMPAPHDAQTFERCKLNWAERNPDGPWLRLHRDLLALRRSDTAFRAQDADLIDGAVLGPELFVLRYTASAPQDERLLIVNFGPDVDAPSFAEPLVAPPEGCTWQIRWSSTEPEYGGHGTPPVVTDAGWRVPAHAAVVLQPQPWWKEQ
jgi:maltooligosyltrehalose trehalohydrolase